MTIKQWNVGMWAGGVQSQMVSEGEEVPSLCVIGDQFRVINFSGILSNPEWKKKQLRDAAPAYHHITRGKNCVKAQKKKRNEQRKTADEWLPVMYH